jgi:pyruvate dehydrogenase E2 component (dihydrolipoyllysine-residue acetyltransferase)
MTDIQSIVMPKWGLAMEEGTLNTWMVAEGTTIVKGQEIAEIETTKITNVFESPSNGNLRRLVAQPGATLPVGSLLAVLAPSTVSDAEIDHFVSGFVVTAADEAAEGGGIAEYRFEMANGRALAYKAAGTDRAGTPALLLHGFGGDSDNWLFNIDALAADRPIYALDLPGHGKSAKQLDQGDLDELVHAATALLDAVKAERAHLVGHSLGGAIALRLWQKYPGRIASFAGIAPAGLGNTVNHQYVRGFIDAEKRKELKAALQMLFADPSLVSAAMIEGIQRFKRLEGAREALRMIAERNFPDGRQTADFRSFLQAVDKPALVIWGERDIILDPGVSEQLPKSVSVERLADVGHMPQMEAARAVNEHLIAHFATAET